MAVSKISTGKSVVALAVVCACFAILWPKIFIPMLQVAFDSSSPNTKHDGHSSLLHPKMRELSRTESIPKKPKQKFPNVGSTTNQLNKMNTIGMMGYIMPVYTVAITIFFFYTILKLIFKNKTDENDDILNQSSSFNDFNTDTNFKNFSSNQKYSGQCIQALVTNYLKSKQLRKKGIEGLIGSYGKEDVSQAIQVLLEDMKNLKLHILQLEEHRHKLCQMNEENQFNKDLEYNDLNYNYSDEEDQEITTDDNLYDKEFDDPDCDKSDYDLDIIGHSTDSDAEE